MCEYDQERQLLETRLKNMTDQELVEYANAKQAASVLELELARRFEIELEEFYDRS